MAKTNHIFQLSEDKNKQLVNIVAELQLCVIVRKDKTRDVLFTDERDWTIVMKCLVRNGFLSATPQRPPLSDFVYWLQSNGLHQLRVRVPHTSTLSRTLSEQFEDCSNYCSRWRLIDEYLQRKLDELQRI